MAVILNLKAFIFNLKANIPQSESRHRPMKVVISRKTSVIPG